MGSNRLTIRVRPDADVNFQERFIKEMSPVLNSGEYYLFNIQSYKEKKQYADFSNGVTQDIRAAQLILSFFIFNIFLGLIGSFWFRIRQRRGEIALRMALGCSRKQVRNQLFTEGLMLLIIAMIPALLVNLNIYFAGLSFSTRMEESALRFVIGQLLTFGLMALMVLLGILFPTRQAMKLQPAEALHEE
jgi:putative ABC transport system permease protein